MPIIIERPALRTRLNMKLQPPRFLKTPLVSGQFITLLPHLPLAGARVGMTTNVINPSVAIAELHRAARLLGCLPLTGALFQ